MLVSIRAFSDNDVFASGYQGRIRHFDGVEWTLMDMGIGQTLYALDGSAPDDLWVGGSSGFLAHYNGSSWMEVASPVIESSIHISGTKKGRSLPRNRGFLNSEIGYPQVRICEVHLV